MRPMSRFAVPIRTAKACRRCASTLASAEDIVGSFLAKHAGSNKAIVRRQTLDGNQLRQLSLTLNRPQLHDGLSIVDGPPPSGTPLPAGYHLAYFTPAELEQDLGADGTDRSFNPDHPFTRRMWAGGQLTWDKDNVLEVGQDVTETTEVQSAELKKTKAGEEMIVVGVQKTFSNQHGPSVVDKRQWLFRRELTDSPTPPPAKPVIEKLPEAQQTRDFRHTPVTLFRFSALTFNAHKIHYSRPWCQQVEGHRDLVVHGPLNLILFLDLWRDGRQGVLPKSITYRATSPLYADEPYRMLIDAEDEATNKAEGRIVDAAGAVGMKATFEAF